MSSSCFKNSYAATGLNAGSEYQFYVTSASDTGESAPSNVLMASTPFEAPTVDVEGTGTVVEGQPYELDLSADYPDGEPGGVDHYLVDWNDGPGGSSNVISYSYPAGADVTQPLVVSHVFNAGVASPNVTVTAVDLINGSFVADAQPVTVTPVSPTNLSVSASGDSITVGWTNASTISTGTTVQLSSDSGPYFQMGDAATGATSLTINNLNTDTNYSVELQTDSVNGESPSTAPQTISTSYAAPTLVVNPIGQAVQGQPYSLQLSATYAPATPDADQVTQWLVNWGEGSGVQTYTAPAGIFQSPTAYGTGVTSATVTVNAIDASGRSISTSPQTVAVGTAPATGPGIVACGPYTLGIAGTWIGVGGEDNASFGYSGPAGTTLTFSSTDPSVLQVLSYTIDANSGLGNVLLKAVSVGTAWIIGRDPYGSVGVSNYITPDTDTVSTGSYPVTEGQTYAPGTEPGFTFATIGSLTPVIVHYTTMGSTLPGSLMSSLSSGTATIPANVGSVFITCPIPDDGVIAPTRVAAVTMIVPGDTDPSVAKMSVIDNDVPTVTMKGVNSTGIGLSDNAVIPLDPQGDNGKLTDIHLDTGTVDGRILSWTLIWDPNDFTMWPTKQIGPAGDDLGSIYFGGNLGRVIDNFNGNIIFTSLGAPPTDIYGQCMNGSSDWDSTGVTFSIQVYKPATEKVPSELHDAIATAKGTANGAEMIWGGKVVTGVLAGDMLIGQGTGLSVVWVGPKPVDLPFSDFYWDLPGSTVGGYSTSSTNGEPIPVDTSQLLNFNTVHFYWGPLGQSGSGVGETVACSGEIDGNSFSVDTHFDIWTPLSTLSFLPANVGVNSSFNYQGGLYAVMGVTSDPATAGANPQKIAGAVYTGSVTMPEPFASQPGSWYIIQLITKTATAQTANNAKWQAQLNGVPDLLDRDAQKTLFNPRNNNSVIGPTAPTDGKSYFAVDSPLTLLATVNPLNGFQTTETIGDVTHPQSAMTRTNGTDKFSDTQMFTPPGTDVISVPLRALGWQWSAGAIKNNAGVWVNDPANMPFVTPAETGPTTSVFPTWTNLEENGWEIAP